MSAEQSAGGTTYNAALIAEKEPGLFLRRLIVAPMLGAEIAQVLEKETKAFYVHADHEKDITKVVYRGLVPQDDEILATARTVLQEFDHELVPFDGLSEMPSADEFNLYLAQRAFQD